MKIIWCQLSTTWAWSVTFIDICLLLKNTNKHDSNLEVWQYRGGNRVNKYPFTNFQVAIAQQFRTYYSLATTCFFVVFKIEFTKSININMFLCLWAVSKHLPFLQLLSIWCILLIKTIDLPPIWEYYAQRWIH